MWHTMEEHAADDDDARNNDTENPPLRKAPTKQQQSPSSSYQTPHTLRLLQLIRDGSPEYAETAVARLQATVTTMMTTSSSSCSFNASTNEPPATNLVVLWDLLGRLALLLLQSPSFATRHTAATALCAVARSVPGHREFLAAPHSSLSVPPPTITTRKRMPLDDDNDTTTTTPLADQQPQQQPRQSLDPPDTTNLSSSSSMPSPDDSSFLVLTVRDLTETATTGTNITGLDRVLESGRELWATAPSRYATRRPDEKDWDDDDDDVRMDSLHPSQTLDNDTKPPTTTRRWLSPYVQARVDYQRRILARRLGLSAVESVLNHRGPIELGAFPSDMYELVSPEDFLALEDPSDDKDRTERRSPRQKAVVGKTNDNRKSTANPQHTTRKRKRTRHYTDHTDNDDDAAQDDAHTRAVAEAVATEPSNNNNSTSIRALLVREMLHQPRSSSSSEQSHHSPQTLLATELIYRLMDPVWYVRHGAALGILALIRAWRNQDFSPGSDVTTTVLYSGLGVWPEDILARCLCVLALDRFGDFSGGALDAAAQHSACCSSFLVVSSSSLSTSVVAPVREVVGQVVALLLAMSTTTIKKIEEDGITPSSASNSEKITNVAENAMSILYRLCRYPSEWEVRHGAIIALKYVVVLLTNAADLQHKDSNPTSRWSILFHSNAWLLQPGNNPVESIAHLATELLMDGSDDVKSVAAQTLFEMARVHPHSSKEHHETVADVKSDLPGYLWESVPALWRAITNVKSVSSCIVDLVALLALFVSHNRDAFLQRIPVGLESAKTSENQHHSIVAFRIVVDFFLGLFDSNFPAVRVSALRSIGTLCHETLVCSQLVRGPVEYQALFDTYTLLLERIFELFYGVPDDANGTLNEYPIDLLDECWKLLCDTCVESSFSGYTAKYERGVSDINSASSSNMARTSVKESLSTRQKLGDLAFCPFDTIDPELSTAALNTKLLTRFFRIGMERSTETKDTLEHVASAKALSYFFGRPSNFHRVHEIAQTALIACFHSPWTSHCEAACLLYRALSMRLNDRSSLRAFEDVLRVDVVLQCLAGTLINEHLSVEWDRAFLLLIQSPGVVKSIDDVTFPSRGALVVGLNDGEVSAKRQEVSSVVAMRVRAILCGAVISKGLPTVLTPLIRSLMTSFNNESTSATRHDQTGKYLTQSLLLMSQETKFEKAYRKVVNALCDAVSETNDINPVERITSRETVAVAVLRSLVGSLPWDNFFSDGSPLKCRLECILTARDSIDDSELADSISLLQIFCGSLDLHGNDSPSLIDTYVPALVTIACLCNIGAVAHNRASSCLESFCSKNPSHSLRAIIPCLTQNLKNRRNDQIRLSTCFALEKMVKASGSYICPYVRQLLPLVLSLVTDRVVECAHLAHSIFAALVRVAPLLRRDTVTSLQPTTQSENVIDHLIFGEPLPKCTYPTRISDALHAKNITLRGYQEEGVAWLRFLWTVNLSGALCDGT